MTDEQFKTLFKRIEAAYNQDYTPLQFEEWLDSFGKEDLGVAERAFRLMKDEFAYPPVVATFRSYLDRVHGEDRASEDRRLAEKKQAESAKRKPMGDGGWIRFSLWMLKTKKKWPPTLDEGRKMKDRFLREHPKKEARC